VRFRRTRLTRPGAGVLGVAAGSGLLGWLIGQPELTGLAALSAIALAAAAAWVLTAPNSTEVTRTLIPARTQVGSEVLVQLRIRNRGRRRVPVQRLSERAGSHGTVTLNVAPIPAGSTRDLTYRYAAQRRGVHRLGPTSITVEDPFALVRTSGECGGVSELIVLPRTWPVPQLPGAAGGQALDRRTPLPSPARHDEEFASLRSYQPGDDLRRVHWRSSARQGRLVVRQYDPPWSRRTTLLLDVRRSCHDEPSFERAVSTAASVIEAARASDDLIRLVTTSGTDSGVISSDDAAALLDQLAAINWVVAGSLTEALDRLRPNPDGRLVICTGALDAPGHSLVTEATRGWTQRHVVVTGRCIPSDRPNPPVLIEWFDGDLDRAWTVPRASPRTVKA